MELAVFIAVGLFFCLGVTYNKFDIFVEDLLNGVHNVTSHTWKAYATNATPSATLDAVKADLAEITPANGYPSGGTDIQNAVSRTGGTASITVVDVTWTATGGPFGPFRYVPVYNDTPTSPADPLVCWWDYGTSITPADGESFTTDFGAALATLA